VATTVTILGAIAASVNVYPVSAILLNGGAALWLIVSWKWKEWSLIVINAALLTIYTVGLILKNFTTLMN
jgi:hypothetical protein